MDGVGSLLLEGEMVVVVAAVDLLEDDEMGMTTLLARQLGQADLSLIVVSGYSDCQAIEMWCRGMYNNALRTEYMYPSQLLLRNASSQRHSRHRLDGTIRCRFRAPDSVSRGESRSVLRSIRYGVPPTPYRPSASTDHHTCPCPPAAIRINTHC